MKLKIKVKRLNSNIQLPQIIDKGDWIDLRCSETVKFEAPRSGVLKQHQVNGEIERYRKVTFDLKYIPLGLAMLLPKGCEAQLVARSSTAKGMGLICSNSIGIIDGPNPIGYCGNNDEWKFAAFSIRDTTIKEGERICQFRVQLSQKATMWQKLKWLFCNGIEIIEVDELNDDNRGGFGSTNN